MRYLSQPQPEIFRHTEAIEAEPCNSASFQSPVYRPLTWQRAEGDAEQRTARFTCSLLLQMDQWQATSHGSTAVRLHGHPKRHRVLQTSVSIERHLSRIPLSFPRSLASVLVPRHFTPARNDRVPGNPNLRHVDVLLRLTAPAGQKHTCRAPGFAPPCGSGFPNKKSSCAICARLRPLRATFFLRSLRRKHISALGAGHLASLRARVSRGQSGQIQTGEKQWQPTETTSL